MGMIEHSNLQKGHKPSFLEHVCISINQGYQPVPVVVASTAPGFIFNLTMTTISHLEGQMYTSILTYDGTSNFIYKTIYAYGIQCSITVKFNSCFHVLASGLREGLGRRWLPP